MKINFPLLALAIGAFGIGTTEFSPMGLLPVIAKGVDVSIPVAGMLISAYAIGVMVGAPLMTLLLSHRARRNALIFLMGIFTVGNLLSSIAPDYTTLLLSRIITSLNHGAFFGLGSVVAASVVPKHKQASAVATMFMGLTIANIGGVPEATWLRETIGWRMSFLATAGLGLLAMVSLWFSLPKGSAGERPDVKKELSVLLRPQVLSALLTTVLGAGAMFTLYTYISPVLNTLTHASSLFITAMLVLIGVGFSLGNYLGGKFADRSVSGTLKGFLLLLMAIMSWVSQGRSPVEYVLMQLADPLLRPIRNLLPSMGGIDFSPMVLVLLLYVINMGIAEVLQATGNVLLPGLWMAL